MIQKETINPIKAAGILPDDLISHAFSGAPPEINGSGRATEKMVNKLGFSYREASLHKDELLNQYDIWESSFFAEKSDVKKLSNEFKLTYGFTPEALRQAWIDIIIMYSNLHK